MLWQAMFKKAHAAAVLTITVCDEEVGPSVGKVTIATECGLTGKLFPRLRNTDYSYTFTGIIGSWIRLSLSHDDTLCISKLRLCLDFYIENESTFQRPSCSTMYLLFSSTYRILGRKEAETYRNEKKTGTQK